MQVEGTIMKINPKMIKDQNLLVMFNKNNIFMIKYIKIINSKLGSKNLKTIIARKFRKRFIEFRNGT